jgi:hypothetical protein
VRFQPQAYDPSPNMTQFPKRDSALNEDSDVPPAPIKSSHKSASGESIALQWRRREKYPDDFEDIISAVRSPRSQPNSGVKLPKSPEDTSGDASKDETVTNDPYRPLAIKPYQPRVDRKDLMKSQCPPGGRYPQLPGSKNGATGVASGSKDGFADNKNESRVKEGKNPAISFKAEPGKTGPDLVPSLSPAEYMNHDEYMATRRFLVEQHMQSPPVPKPVKKDCPLTIEQVKAFFGIEPEEPAQPEKPEKAAGVKRWLDNVNVGKKAGIKPSPPHEPSERKRKIIIPPMPTCETVVGSSGVRSSCSPYVMKIYEDAYLYCRLGGCKERFMNPEDLKDHRYYEHGDCYCVECELGFDDFEQMAAHKMESSRHIACPQCGVEFKSKEGRDCHVNVVS